MLELLEDILQQYQGTVLLVSHDREFVNNTVTSSLLFAGEGRIIEIAGGYDDVIAYQQRQQKVAPASQKATKNEQSFTEQPAVVAVASSSKKLSYKEKRELEQMPALIEQLETELEALQTTVNNAEFFKQSAEHTQATLNQLQQTESKLAQAYARWEQLDA